MEVLFAYFPVYENISRAKGRGSPKSVNKTSGRRAEPMEVLFTCFLVHKKTSQAEERAPEKLSQINR